MHSLLQQLGLTDAEARVYLALAHLGTCTSGPLIKESDVSSSKVYLLLDKLIEKGLASYTVSNGVKEFSITHPSALLDVVKTQEHDLQLLKQDLEREILTLQYLEPSKHAVEAARGFRGVRAMYSRVLDTLEEGDAYDVLAVTSIEARSDEVRSFFREFHVERAKRGITLRVLGSASVLSEYMKHDILSPRAEARVTTTPVPTGTVIGKDRVLLITLDDDERAFEIVSPALARHYAEYFTALWTHSSTRTKS